MRRISLISIVLVLVPCIIFAQSLDFNLTTETPTVNPGDNISIDIVINPSSEVTIYTLEAYVEYASAVFDVPSITDNLESGYGWAVNDVDPNYDTNGATWGIQYSKGTFSGPGWTISSDGIAYQINFTVRSDAPLGETTLNFGPDPFYSASDENFAQIPVSIYELTVTIVEESSAEINGNFSVDEYYPTVNEQVTFTDLSTASGTSITSWGWDFDGDDVIDETTQGPHNFTYTSEGTYPAKLTVSDGSRIESTKIRYITVSNEEEYPPTEITIPAGNMDPQDFGNGMIIQFSSANSEELILDVSQIHQTPDIIGGSLPNGLENIAPLYWGIEVISGTLDGTYNLTLDLSSISGISDFSTIHLLSRDNPAQSWSDLGVPTDISGAPNVVIWSGQTTFSEKGIGGFGDNPLPAELTNFYAEVVKGGIKLHWSTASEINNAGFKVYKKTGHSSWLPCSDLIPGHGTTSEPQEYSFIDKDVQPDVLYTYRLADIEEGTGNETLHPPITIMATEEGLSPKETPQTYRVNSNYPNPFNPETTIEFELPRTTQAEIKVYDTSGKLVRTLVNESLAAGYHKVTWNGKDDNGRAVNSGIYFYRLVASDFVSETKRMVLLK